MTNTNVKLNINKPFHLKATKADGTVVIDGDYPAGANTISLPTAQYTSVFTIDGKDYTREMNVPKSVIDKVADDIAGKITSGDLVTKSQNETAIADALNANEYIDVKSVDYTLGKVSIEIPVKTKYNAVRFAITNHINNGLFGDIPADRKMSVGIRDGSKLTLMAGNNKVLDVIDFDFEKLGGGSSAPAVTFDPVVRVTNRLKQDNIEIDQNTALEPSTYTKDEHNVHLEAGTYLSVADFVLEGANRDADIKVSGAVGGVNVNPERINNYRKPIFVGSTSSGDHKISAVTEFKLSAPADVFTTIEYYRINGDYSTLKHKGIRYIKIAGSAPTGLFNKKFESIMPPSTSNTPDTAVLIGQELVTGTSENKNIFLSKGKYLLAAIGNTQDSGTKMQLKANPSDGYDDDQIQPISDYFDDVAIRSMSDQGTAGIYMFEAMSDIKADIKIKVSNHSIVFKGMFLLRLRD